MADDATGRVGWQEDRRDRRIAFAYGVTTVANPAGQVVRYEHSDGICRAVVRDPGSDESRWDFEVDEETRRPYDGDGPQRQTDDRPVS